MLTSDVINRYSVKRHATHKGYDKDELIPARLKKQSSGKKIAQNFRQLLNINAHQSSVLIHQA